MRIEKPLNLQSSEERTSHASSVFDRGQRLSPGYRAGRCSHFVEWLNDPEVRCYLGRNFPPLNLRREREWIENLYKDRNSVTFGVVLKESDKLIGSTGFGNIDWRNRRAAFGIAIGDKPEWSKGYGAEAIKLVVRYGFDTLNLNRILLHVFDHNPRAMRAYGKAGFVKEGFGRIAT